MSGKIMKEFTALRAKTYSYLAGNNNEDKEAKNTKKCAIKTRVKFDDYKNCQKQLEFKIKYSIQKKINLNVDNLPKIIKNSYKNSNLILKSQQRLRSE